MIVSAMKCNDYGYINHSGKRVVFSYKSNKRHKTKVINFLKNNHDESKINQFLEPLNLKLNQYATSRRYIHYEIIDL